MLKTKKIKSLAHKKNSPASGEEGKFRILVEAMNEGALALRRGGKILFCNKRFGEMAGKSIKRLPGKSFTKLIHAGERKEFISFLKNSVNKSQIARFFLISRKNTLLPVQISARRLQSSGDETIGIVVTDLSDISKATENLMKSEVFYKSIIENSSDIKILLDKTGKIIFASPVLRKKYGYTEKEILNLDLYKFIHPDDLKNTKKLFRDALKSPSLPVPFTFRNRKKDKTYLWVEGTAANFLDMPGVNAVICNFTDVTEKKAADDELKKFNRELTLLYEAQMELSKTLDLNSIYDKTYEIVSEIMPCDSMVISSYNKDDNMLRCLSVWADGQKLDVSTLPELPLAPSGYGIQSPVIRSGKAKLIQDYKSFYKKTISKFSKVSGRLSKKPARLYSAAIVVPVKAEGNVIGTIQVFSYKNSAYNKDDLRLLELLTAPISAATVNASLYQRAQNEIAERKKIEDELKKKTDEISLHYEAEKELSSTLDLNEIYNKIFEIVSKIMPCEGMSIAAFDEEKKEIKISAFWQNGSRRSPDSFPVIKYNPEGGIQSRVIRTAKPLLLNDYDKHFMKSSTKYFITDDNKISQKPAGTTEISKSALLSPILSEGKVIGVIQVLSLKQNAYNNDHMRVLETLAAQSAAATVNARLYEQSQTEVVERVKKEKELDEIRKNLEEAQRISHLGSWSLDLVTNTVFNSDEVYRILGLTPLKGNMDFETALSFVFDEDKENTHNTINNAILQKTSYINEDRIRRPDGEIRYVRVLGEPIFDEKGNLTAMQGTMQDITDVKRIHNELMVSISEKELMLKEIHHRVKNNLQVVSSLLRLQADKLQDKTAAEYLKLSDQRVKSMALIHQQLYRTKDLGRISFGEYLNELCTYLLFSYGVSRNRVNLKINVEQIFFGIDTALPCGLIVNELLTNSIKHAFPDERSGNIDISLTKDKDGINNLLVKDDGVGAGSLNIKESSTLGIELVNTLTEQLDGKITVTTAPGKGTEVKISFGDLFYKSKYTV